MRWATSWLRSASRSSEPGGTPRAPAPRRSASQACNDVAVTTSFKRLETAVAASLLLLALFAIWQALGMPMGTAAMPGAGVMPVALGVLLALCALVLIVWRDKTGSSGDVRVIVGHRLVALGIVATAVAGLLFERVGFLDHVHALPVRAATVAFDAGHMAVPARRRCRQRRCPATVPEPARRLPAADSVHALIGPALIRHGCPATLAARVHSRAAARQSAVLRHRLPVGHRGGRSAGSRPARRPDIAAAAYVSAGIRLAR